MTKKEIKALVGQGKAKEIKEKEDIPFRYAVIGVSSGVYGMNGILIQNSETGQLLAVSERNSMLYYF